MNAIMCKKGLEHPRPHNDHSFDSVMSVIDLGNLEIRPKSSQTAKSTEAYNSLKPFLRSTPYLRQKHIVRILPCLHFTHFCMVFAILVLYLTH